MLMSELEFVTGEQALKVGKTLVVSDLHIGIEYRYRRDGISLPSQSGRMYSRIENLIRQTKAKRLLILGDVKHKVPGTSFQEEREIPGFFRKILELARVEVVPGNHDGGLEKLLPSQVVVHPSKGVMLDRTWFCHGHAWPDEGFLKAREVVVGHNHSGVEFRDKLGYRWIEPVWIRTRFERKGLLERYSIKRGTDLPELVLIPVFNEFSGLVAANRKRANVSKYLSKDMGPLLRVALKKEAGIFMLDGTHLGNLKDL
jgi:putative SbcD/Mre11-related phosphoesterase